MLNIISTIKRGGNVDERRLVRTICGCCDFTAGLHMRFLFLAQLLGCSVCVLYKGVVVMRVPFGKLAGKRMGSEYSAEGASQTT